MLQAFVVTLREGLEAFLIVAISLAYLRKSGRQALVPAVHWGIVASILVSIGAGVLLARAANQALWEGVLALVAAALVATLIVHMWRAGRHMKRDIESRLEASSIKTGAAAFAGIFAFTLLMISREGMETALLMNALLFQVRSMDIVMGAAAGTLTAAFIAWLWSRYGHRVNLARFFQVTAVFLLVFVVQLHHLRLPRIDGGLRRGFLARRHRAFRPRWHLRPVPHLHARPPAARVAGSVESVGSSARAAAIADGVSSPGAEQAEGTGRDHHEGTEAHEDTRITSSVLLQDFASLRGLRELSRGIATIS